MEKKINGGSNWITHVHMEIGHKNCVCVCVCVSVGIQPKEKHSKRRFDASAGTEAYRTAVECCHGRASLSHWAPHRTWQFRRSSVR